MINHVGLAWSKKGRWEQKDGLNWLLLSCPKSLVGIIVTHSVVGLQTKSRTNKPATKAHVALASKYKDNEQ